jgi:hypothetical protein
VHRGPDNKASLPAPRDDVGRHRLAQVGLARYENQGWVGNGRPVQWGYGPAMAWRPLADRCGYWQGKARSISSPICDYLHYDKFVFV